MGNDATSQFIFDEAAVPGVSTDLTSGGFTQLTDVPSHGYSRLVKARRYDRWWMLKGLKEEHRGQDIYETMLRKEFAIIVSLQHPGIVSACTFEDVQGVGWCIVMEWVDGITLGEWLRLPAPCPCAEARRRVFMQLLDAVEYVHSRQVVHRDIKPSNILVTRNGEQVKLIDFGLSDTDSHAVLKQPAGTRGYISPEQLSGGDTDQRNDIYSLGCVLDDLDLGMAARRIADRCRQPIDRRYASVADLRSAFIHRHRVSHVVMAALLLAVVVVAALSVWRGLGTAASGEPTEYNDKIKVDNAYYWINRVHKRTLDLMGAIPDADGRVFLPDSVVYGGEVYHVQYIGDYAFNDSHVCEIVLPNTTEIIGLFALYGLQLKTLTLPESVWSLQRGAVGNCKLLERVEMGSGVRVIDLDAFTGCDRLRDIVIHTPEPPSLGEQSQQIFDNVTIHVPAASVELYRNHDMWGRFSSIEAI